MNKLLLLAIFILLIILQPCFSSAAPEGELYWVVETYPDQFFLHNTTDTYNGAEPAIDYACQQSPGTGTYTGDVRMLDSSTNYPAEKAGYCRNTRPFVPTPFDGNLYTAYLYCNGEKREQMDNSPCESPAFDPDHNLGACPPK
jgi:hypothetical protein